MGENGRTKILILGGGFAGGETVAGVNDFLREAVRFYPHLKEEMLRVVLVHPGEVILPEPGEKLGRYAQQKLAERGVEIRTKTKVAAVTDREVTLTDGERIVSNTLVWTAGTSPNPLLETLPCRRERGRLWADSFLEVEGRPGVWALGDCASVPDPHTGKPCPPAVPDAARALRLAHRRKDKCGRSDAGTPNGGSGRSRRLERPAFVLTQAEQNFL